MFLSSADEICTVDEENEPAPALVTAATAMIAKQVY